MAFRPASIVRIAIANDYVAHRARVAPRQWHWTEIVAIPIAAISMLTFALTIAAEPWVRNCDPAAIRPIALASLLRQDGVVPTRVVAAGELVVEDVVVVALER